MRVFCRGLFCISLRMPLRRLDPGAIVDLCDAVESKIYDKVRPDVRSEI